MAAELEEDEPWVASQTLKIPKVMAENTLLFLGITTTWWPEKNQGCYRVGVPPLRGNESGNGNAWQNLASHLTMLHPQATYLCVCIYYLYVYIYIRYVCVYIHLYMFSLCVCVRGSFRNKMTSEESSFKRRLWQRRALLFTWTKPVEENELPQALPCHYTLTHQSWRTTCLKNVQRLYEGMHMMSRGTFNVNVKKTIINEISTTLDFLVTSILM